MGSSTDTEFKSYARPTLDEDDIEAVVKVLKTPNLTRGEEVREFEQGVMDFTGASYAICFPNASLALWAAVRATDPSPHDQIFTSTNTFVTSATCGLLTGLKLHLIDIEPATGMPTVEKALETLRDKKASRGKNIFIPVHYAGVPFDIKGLNDQVIDPKLVIIEDASHAFGSCYFSGEPVGSCPFSDMTVFSFHPCKNITTGEGGMVTTNDPLLAKKLKTLRDSGIERLQLEDEPWRYDVTDLSTNLHINNFQAALGLSQLKKEELFREHRKVLVERYRHKLEGSPIQLVTAPSEQQIHYHLAAVQIPFDQMKLTRGELMKALQAEGIGTQVHYIPLYRHSYIKNRLKLSDEDFKEDYPGSEAFYSNALSLPLYASLDIETVDKVCEFLLKNL